MKEWNNPKFKHLLTSNIWSNKPETISSKFNLDCFKDDKYLHLLNPSIFSISSKNIINGIELLKEYGIDQYITNKCLRFKTKFLKNLLDYLIDNNIDLVTYNHKTGKYSLNPILSSEKGILKKRYNIDVDIIEKESFKKNR